MKGSWKPGRQVGDVREAAPHCAAVILSNPAAKSTDIVPHRTTRFFQCHGIKPSDYSNAVLLYPVNDFERRAMTTYVLPRVCSPNELQVSDSDIKSDLRSGYLEQGDFRLAPLNRSNAFP